MCRVRYIAEIAIVVPLNWPGDVYRSQSMITGQLNSLCERMPQFSHVEWDETDSFGIVKNVDTQNNTRIIRNVSSRPVAGSSENFLHRHRSRSGHCIEDRLRGARRSANRRFPLV